MSNFQKTDKEPPSCPLCAAQTVLKQTHREGDDKMLLIFKCASCALEYPVISSGQDSCGTPRART